MIKMFSQFKIAFTLAEVLITLAIIGVVAALTLPSVINNIQGRQLQSALKKSYSTISQALDMYYAENGERVTNVGNHNLKPILMKYIKNIKDCGFGSEDAGKACINNGNDNKSDVYKTFNGLNEIDLNAFDDGQFIINDGSLVLLDNWGSRSLISIDVNGYNKKPNRLGQDLFIFQIMPDGRLLPMGMDGTKYPQNKYCSLTSTNNMNGAGCTVKALNEKDFFKKLPK